MRQKSGDIALVEGNNELNIQMAPIVVPIAGEMSHIWMWHEPLEQWGIVWCKTDFPPGLMEPEIPLNEDIYLVPCWDNTCEVSIVGHVDLEVTYPDGTKVSPSATAGQDAEVLPGKMQPVDFYSAFIATQEGTYTIKVTLSSEGQVLDSVTFTLVVVAPSLPFSMYISKIDTTTNKYAKAYWLMEVTCQISNPHSYPITHELYCYWAFGSRDPNDPASFKYSRQMERYTWPDEFLSVTLNPGQSVTLVSPFYYIDGWHDGHMNYEWSNSPLGMYSAGVRKKYYFRIIDELGNWSPYKSVGSA